ncbi:MAG: tRNA (adenosine(37)-N6)-dimethylallyltransferase MiaA [Tissierellia bacterium]|nr:tRNA (adenosine(37)-N6)-dimethylallyltransferase MiaA [Tissierellia bacterium]
MNAKENLLIILGPTGVGKTTISLEVAKNLKGEIISCDSMQIYKYMNIGTAKIMPEEMDNIPHYLIDIVYPDEEFTVHDFKVKAEEHIMDINNRGSLPIMVGGTGLYINSIVYELKFTNVKPNEEFRRKYNHIANKYGNEYLYEKLLKIDPISAERININDRKRIIRALEIYNETNKPMSYYNKDFRKERDKYNLIMIGLNMDRYILYSHINNRVERMFEKGLVDEVESLLNMGYDENLVSMKAIGYKEIIPYLKKEISLEESMELLKRNTRRYAKRQLTWFRRDNRIKWIDINKFDSIESIGYFISNYVRKILNI